MFLTNDAKFLWWDDMIILYDAINIQDKFQGFKVYNFLTDS